MRIRKENIHESRIKCKNTLQITLDDDFNVPDSKADIENIVKEWGNVHVDNVKNSGDRAEVSGSLDFAFLYTGKSHDKIMPVKMAGSMNFNESINLAEDSDNTYMTCNAVLEDITVKAINSRKVSIKAIISINVICEEITDVTVGCEADDILPEEQVQILQKNICYTQLAVNLHDNFRIRENVMLTSGKPDIAEILWDDIAIRNLNSRLTDDGISLNGELGIFIMYMPPEENGTVQCYENSVAFDGKLDINGCNPDMISCVKYSIVSKNIEVKPNYDGENRDISVELVLDLTLKAYEEKEKNVIADMYSPVKKVTLTQEPAAFRRLLLKNNSKCRVSERVKVGDYVNMLQICNCTGNAQIDDVEVQEDGIQVDGALIVNVFYITTDDNNPMGSVRAAIPFSNKLQVNVTENLEYNMEVNVDQLSAVMTGTNEIEVKGCVAIDAIMFDAYQSNVVNDCEIEDYDESEFLKFPGLVGYISNGEDTIWDIAKKYHTTTESIRTQNRLVPEKSADDMKVKRGEKLLLVKTAR